MNKQDLIQKVMNDVKTELTKADAERAVNAVFNGIKDALVDGDTVQLIGFGTFSVKERAAREARNPQTGGTLHIPAKKAPVFKAGKALKDVVNG